MPRVDQLVLYRESDAAPGTQAAVGTCQVPPCAMAASGAAVPRAPEIAAVAVRRAGGVARRAWLGDVLAVRELPGSLEMAAVTTVVAWCGA